MSKAQIDYDLVAQELTKDMFAVDSPQVAWVAKDKPDALMDFRTVRMGAGRHRGIEAWLVDKFVDHPGATLILSANMEMAKTFSDAIIERAGLSRRQSGMILGDDIPDYIRNYTFDRVFIIEAGRYFSKWKPSKVYHWLAECCTDDVIIYQLN